MLSSCWRLSKESDAFCSHHAKARTFKREPGLVIRAPRSCNPASCPIEPVSLYHESFAVVQFLNSYRSESASFVA
jgi:hypothetical protein